MLRRVAARSLLSKVPKRSPVPELTQPISGRIERQAVGSGIFGTPMPWAMRSMGFAVGPHHDPHLGPHLGPRSGVPGVPQPAALAALHHRVPQGWCWPWLVQAPSIAHRAASLARRPQRRYAKNPGPLGKFAALQRITLAIGRPPAAASPSICVRCSSSAPSARLLRAGRWSAVRLVSHRPAVIFEETDRKSVV